MAWSMKGTYLESCGCDAICPCITLSAPTKGDCSVLIAWQIDQGTDGDVKLDGLRVALLVHAPGKMHETKWRAAAYIDERASEAQKSALIRIFGGQAGGHPAGLASMIGEMVGVKSAKIDIAREGKKVHLQIPDIAEVELEPIVGGDGGDVTVSNHPFGIAPGFAAVVARSTKSRVKDHGWDWTLDGGQCMTSPFAYSGEG